MPRGTGWVDPDQVMRTGRDELFKIGPGLNLVPWGNSVFKVQDQPVRREGIELPEHAGPGRRHVQDRTGQCFLNRSTL